MIPLIVLLVIVGYLFYPKSKTIGFKACQNQADHCMPETPKCLGVMDKLIPKYPDTLRYRCYGIFY